MGLRLCRESAAARDTEVKAAVARLAKISAISEMQLQSLRLQAEGNRIGQLGICSNGIMGSCSTAHDNHPTAHDNHPQFVIWCIYALAYILLQ